MNTASPRRWMNDRRAGAAAGRAMRDHDTEQCEGNTVRTGACGRWRARVQITVLELTALVATRLSGDDPGGNQG